MGAVPACVGQEMRGLAANAAKVQREIDATENSFGGDDSGETLKLLSES